MSEADVQRRIQTQVRNAGGWVLKVHGNQYTPVGTPDLLICHQGKFAAIEVKQYGNKPSEVQRHSLKLIARAGGLTTIAYPDFDFRTWFDAQS